MAHTSTPAAARLAALEAHVTFLHTIGAGFVASPEGAAARKAARSARFVLRDQVRRQALAR